MVKKSVRANSRIKAALLTATAANPAPSSSTQRKQPQHTGEPIGVHIATALSPVEQALCRQAFQIF